MKKVEPKESTHTPLESVGDAVNFEITVISNPFAPMYDTLSFI